MVGGPWAVEESGSGVIAGREALLALAFEAQPKVSERHLTKTGFEWRIEGGKMQVGFEMGLKFSNQCSEEVGGRSKLSKRYLEKAEFG